MKTARPPRRLRTTAPLLPRRSRRRPALRALTILGFALALGAPAWAQSILGSTASYAVMSGSTATINGVNSFNGNLGAAGVAGAGSMSFVTGSSVGPMTAQNQTDFTRAYTGLAAMPGAIDLTGKILGNGGVITTLTPGIYRFTSTAQLTGTLTLDAQGQTNAVWVFQVGTTLTTADSSTIVFSNLAANSVTTNGIFWQVGSTTVFGANTSFEGNVLSGTSFTVGSSARINHGRALTGTGQTITLDGNTINFTAADSGYSGGLAFVGEGNAIGAIPEPSTYAFTAGAVGLVAVLIRRCSRAATRNKPFDDCR